MLDSNAFLPMLYASHDGHTIKIIDRLAMQLEAMGIDTLPIDLGRQTPDPELLKKARMVLVAAPIRFGYHLPPVEAFVRDNRSWLRSRLLTVISVNLTARKAGKNTPATNPYLRKWLWRHKLSPVLAAVFGGRLDYSLCCWWEKRMIQLIMKITGGPTNLDAVVDYTDWDKVDALAFQIAGFYTRRQKMESEAPWQAANAS